MRKRIKLTLIPLTLAIALLSQGCGVVSGLISGVVGGVTGSLTTSGLNAVGVGGGSGSGSGREFVPFNTNTNPTYDENLSTEPPAPLKAYPAVRILSFRKIGSLQAGLPGNKHRSEWITSTQYEVTLSTGGPFKIACELSTESNRWNPIECKGHYETRNQDAWDNLDPYRDACYHQEIEIVECRVELACTYRTHPDYVPTEDEPNCQVTMWNTRRENVLNIQNHYTDYRFLAITQNIFLACADWSYDVSRLFDEWSVPCSNGSLDSFVQDHSSYGWDCNSRDFCHWRKSYGKVDVAKFVEGYWDGFVQTGYTRDVSKYS